MDFDTIIKSITSGLTGNAEHDIKYLQDQCEKYKDHEYGKEIMRACGRMIFDLLPQDKKDMLNLALDNDNNAIEETLKEIRFNIQERDYKKALKISKTLVKNIEKMNMYQNDAVSEYYCFNNIFEELLFKHYNKPEKNVRYSNIPYSKIYFTYANLLFEFKKYKEAQEYLEKAIRWNPMDCNLQFEYAEIYKCTKNYDKFFELTKNCFKCVYNSADLARCYRNLGYYFIEKGLYTVAIGCYMLSIQYDETVIAQSQLYYIHTKAPNCKRPDMKEMQVFSERYKFPIGPYDDVLSLALTYGQKMLEDGRVDFAIFFLEIFYELTGDKNVEEILIDLKSHMKDKDE